jgi:CRP-like cAMP-binding protein
MNHSKHFSDQLTELAPFAGCSCHELRRIDRLTTQVSVPHGTVLAKQGRPARQYVVVVDGTAHEVLDGRRVATLGRGDDFGGLGLAVDATHPATVVAETPMVLLVMNQVEFRSAYDDVHALRRHVDDEAARIVTRWDLAKFLSSGALQSQPALRDRVAR